MVSLIGLAVYVTITPLARADERSLATGEHIITLHDDGTDKGFITKKQTLREALVEAGIVLDENDRTEPSIDTELVASSYHVNIYRARTVVIKDGAQLVKVITSYRTGQQIAKQAGIAVRDEDDLRLSQSDNPTRDGAAEVLTIRRAISFTFDFYGKATTAYTQAKTVGDMLAEKNISMAANDVITPSTDTPLAAGMSVRLYRNGVQTVTVDEDVPFETEQIKDANRDKGYKEVKTAGVNGKKTVTYQITIENGVEVARQEINSNITQQPVKQVEIIGAKNPAMPYTGGGNKDQWLAASVIPRDQWGYAEWLVQKESGWNPNAVNRSSGACGLAQALPCSKVGSDPYNPVVSLNWMHGYVVGRYGSWEAAVNHSKTKGWY